MEIPNIDAAMNYEDLFASDLLSPGSACPVSQVRYSQWRVANGIDTPYRPQSKAAPGMADALRLAVADLQLISDENGGSHGRTIDACLAALAKAGL